jgi:hypothetical protein
MAFAAKYQNLCDIVNPVFSRPIPVKCRFPEAISRLAYYDSTPIKKALKIYHKYGRILR